MAEEVTFSSGAQEVGLLEWVHFESPQAHRRLACIPWEVLAVSPLTKREKRCGDEGSSLAESVVVSVEQGALQIDAT